MHNLNSGNEIEVCTKDEFTCQNGTCIPIEAVCDGAPDCFDSDDEIGETCSCHSSEVSSSKLHEYHNPCKQKLNTFFGRVFIKVQFLKKKYKMNDQRITQHCQKCKSW